MKLVDKASVRFNSIAPDALCSFFTAADIEKNIAVIGDKNKPVIVYHFAGGAEAFAVAKYLTNNGLQMLLYYMVVYSVSDGQQQILMDRLI